MGLPDNESHRRGNHGRPKSGIPKRKKTSTHTRLSCKIEYLPRPNQPDRSSASEFFTDDYIGSDRLLTHKLEAGQSPIAHSKPKFCFGVGRVGPQLADSSNCLSIWSAHQLPLTRLAPSALATLSPLRGARVWSSRRDP